MHALMDARETKRDVSLIVKNENAELDLMSEYCVEKRGSLRTIARYNRCWRLTFTFVALDYRSCSLAATSRISLVAWDLDLPNSFNGQVPSLSYETPLKRGKSHHSPELLLSQFWWGFIILVSPMILEAKI